MIDDKIARLIEQGEKKLVLRDKDAKEFADRMLAVRKKKDEKYREIVFTLVPEAIHPYIQPFEWVFESEPQFPQPGQPFYVDIPGFEGFHFTFQPHNPFPNYYHRVNEFGKYEEFEELDVLLAELRRLSVMGYYDQDEPVYEDFPDDGPNADPEVDEAPSHVYFDARTGFDPQKSEEWYHSRSLELIQIINEAVDKRLNYHGLI